MRDLFDAIDNADIWVVFCVLLVFLYALELLATQLRERAHRRELARERAFWREFRS